MRLGRGKCRPDDVDTPPGLRPAAPTSTTIPAGVGETPPLGNLVSGQTARLRRLAGQDNKLNRPAVVR